MSAAATKPQPEVAGEILILDPNQIDTDEANRIGQFFPLKAEGLACRMDVDGQLEPIGVARAGSKAKKPWKLVYGRHRHWACLSRGRMIEARVVSGSADQLRKLQASENLDRRRMTVLEEAMFVAAVAEVAQAQALAQHGVTSMQALGAAKTNARGKFAPSAVRSDGGAYFAHPGSTSDELAAADADAEAALYNLSTAYGWRQEVCDALGYGVDKVKRFVRIHRQLVLPFPVLMEALKEHPVADNASALLKLASIAKEGREAELRALIDGPSEPAEATTPLDPKVKLYNSALKSLNRMTEIEHDALIEARIEALTITSKRRILAQLQDELGKGGKS